MDVQTGLVYVGVVVISAAFILLVSMFGIKEKSYEEAIAEQRKLPDDLLLNKKDKGKEKKHKNKAGKKVKEKKEEKDDREEKEEKAEHVQFEETPHILSPELPIQDANKGNKKKSKVDKVKPILLNKDEPTVVANEINLAQPLLAETNHFDQTQPKDDLELVRSHSRENLQQTTLSEPIVNKSPKDTPTKSKKSIKDVTKKKDENIGKEDRKDVNINNSVPVPANKECAKEAKDQQKETPVKEVKEIIKDVNKEAVISVQSSNKESKKTKKKNDILAQIGGDKDAVNVSLLILFIQKAELSRSEIQILIDQLLNKQLDNPLEHSEWTEGRADPVIKLKKQLAEKEKALADEHEASVAFQNKLKELRSELNAEKCRLSANVRQLEEALHDKMTENQTLHTRMQHILESHAAEKQGFARQIEQLQTKVNEDATIIHKMQEDQGQTQGHMQQELMTQRKQMEVQFAQIRDNENALKAQLAQKIVEVQDLQNQLQATCESSTAEIELLRQQLAMMQGQLMHSEGQLQHFKEMAERLQDVARQLEDSHLAHAESDHRLKNAHRHEQELQKQVNALQAELNLAKTEANDASTIKSELNKAQAELWKVQSELSTSVNEAKSEAAEATALKSALSNAREELNTVNAELKKSVSEKKQLESLLSNTQKDLDSVRPKFDQAVEIMKSVQQEVTHYKNECESLNVQLAQAQSDLAEARKQIAATNEATSEFSTLKAEISRLQGSEKKSTDAQLYITQLQEENNRFSVQAAELQKEVKQLHQENESLASQLAATTERPAAEGRENGIDEKIQKNNAQLVEHANLLAQKDSQLDALKMELAHKQTELAQLNEEVDALRSGINSHQNFATRLQDALEVQKTKNNELRTKNWKVMEALSAAESRVKSSSGKNIDVIAERIKVEQEELTKTFLQRVFPEIRVSEKRYEEWITAFEDKIHSTLSELRKQDVPNADLAEQNKNLQSMVTNYEKIIADTEAMLNKLQSHVESEETRWQAQLREKENEVGNLWVELTDLQTTLSTNRTLQQKLSDLEARLLNAESVRDQTTAELAAFRSTQKPVHNREGQACDIAALEKLQEEKARLSEELQIESNRRAALDAEVVVLRSLTKNNDSGQIQEKKIENEICDGCSNSEQSVLNGPPSSNTPQSEPPLAAQTLIAALESTFLKKTEFAKCSISNPVNLVQSQQEIDNSPFTSKYSSKSCHMTDHNTQASWNPLIGQQHKKHKKKRKGGSGKK